MGDLAAKIFALLGTTPRVEQDPSRMRPAGSEVERLLADATRANTELNWSPQTPFDDGLMRTIEFVRDHLDRYRPSEYAR